MSSFDADWSGAQQTPITPDWSPRAFTRLRAADGRTAVLMQAPAGIAGHGLDDFIRLSGLLRAMDLSAPAIYERRSADTALIEDFGDTPIDAPAIEREGYEAAVDILSVFRMQDVPLVRYADGYIFKKLAQFSPDPGWMQAWAQVGAALPPCPHVFSHMDYKAGNLHWLAERTGMNRIGILDFQAAQSAPFVYDIVNLLEDARRNLAPALKTSLKARFRDALPRAWKNGFEDWYTVIAAQFHARVLGQIAGNARVADDVAPRLRAYLREELTHPVLAPIRSFTGDL